MTRKPCADAGHCWPCGHDRTPTERCRVCRAAYVRRRRAENPELFRQRFAKWAKANPEYQRERLRNWASTHRENFASKESQRRATAHGAPGSGISSDQWRDILESTLGLCVYCGQRRKLEVDHIEPTRHGGAHEPENAAPACRSCNASKHNRSLLVWLAKRRAA